MNNISTDTKKLSIAIVVYHPDVDAFLIILTQLIRACDHCFNHAGFSSCIYIIDNSVSASTTAAVSKDDNKARQNENKPLPQTCRAALEALNITHAGISLIYRATGSNVGYGRANNCLLSELNSRYHLIMNPDVSFAQHTLTDAIQFLEAQTQAGLLSPAIYSPDGRQQYFCKQNPDFFIMFLRGFAPLWLKKHYQHKLDAFENRSMDYQQPHYNIPFLSGCFLLFRTDIFKALQGFDPRFFLYFEDADITRRTLTLAKSIYLPAIKITHEWTRGAHHHKRLRRMAIKSGLQYCWKWLGKGAS